MFVISEGDSALRYAYTSCFGRYSMPTGTESRHFLLRDFVVIHYENGNSKKHSRVVDGIKCLNCCEVRGCGTDSTCERACLEQGDRQLQRSTPVRRYDYLKCQHAVETRGGGGGGVGGRPSQLPIQRVLGSYLGVGGKREIQNTCI